MSEYTHTKHALKTAETIIRTKVRQQATFLPFIIVEPRTLNSVETLLLFEGRHAQKYWKVFRNELPDWTNFISRRPRNTDIVNRLLDIGYHYLATIITQICTTHEMTSSLGVIHKAKTEKSKPLVYDLMELFRADTIDREVMRYCRLKKKSVPKLTSRDIGKFLKRVRNRMERKVYVKEFKQCHTYRYYMEIQILKFQKAVNHKDVFKPVILPTRHESRC